MRPTKKQRRGTSLRSFLWDLLTFERLLTGPVLHLIYWAGLAVVAALVLLWRGFCEFYVAVFRISEDLRALRQSSELKDSKSPPPGAL